MSTAKQVLFGLAEEMRDLIGGETQAGEDNPVDTFFGTASSESEAEHESEDEIDDEIDMDQTVEELFNLTLDEQDF